MPKEILLSGTPFDRGTVYGAACRDEIRLTIDSYSRMFLQYRHFSWQKACELSLQYVDAIRNANPDYLAEMEGIAHGAGLQLADILSINCRSELLYATGKTQECTAFSLLPPATADCSVLAGQNWDYELCQRDAVVILRVPAQNGKPAIIMFPEAGMIGAMGMNSAGLSLTLNALSAKGSSPGLPLHIRMRQILEQSTMERAFRMAVSGGQPAPANLILTHKDGIALGLELDCGGIDVLQPKNGRLFHTNHFIGPKFALRTHAANANTYIRLQRMEALLGSRTDLRIADVKAALQDHAGYPYSICMHTDPANPKSPLQQGSTNFALIMDLTAGVLYFAPGNPCQSQFTLLRI